MHRPQRLVSLFFAILCVAQWLSAAPPLTQISDLLYKADGKPFTGLLTISWKSFTASDASSIPANSMNVQVVAGVLKLRLVPTTNALTQAFYTVRYNADGRTQFNEIWAVPPSAGSVTVRGVRMPDGAQPPGGTTQPPANIDMGSIPGLNEALADRAAKSIAFIPGRAAVIDADGKLAGAAGALGDCVRVDGTSSRCAPTFVDLESPAGALDGINATFVLAKPPSPAASLHVYRNGILQRAGVDFDIAGDRITFLPVSVPQQGDILQASYRAEPQ